jgi:GT2 family glycosyltransferase
MEGADALVALEQDVRDVFQAVKEHAADIPDEHEAPSEDFAPPRIAAIVVSFHTGDVLFDCLAALQADEDIGEIVLVNNGNPPAAVSRLSEMAAAGKLKLVGEGVNRGFAAGVNLGVAASTADRFLIINPDAILQQGSVVALESAITNAAEPAIVGGRIYGADGREQRGSRRRKLTMRSAAATFLGAGLLRAMNPAFVNINRHEEPQPPGPVPMDAVSGALMYMTRHGFERLGGFDEGYFMHVEDLDICRRAEADGGAVIYTPFASALHHGATSDAPSLVVERHKAAGFNRYFRKFAGTRGEQMAARVVGPVIGFLLVTRARLKRK